MQDSLSYESICTLIGKLILQNQFQIEQLGKALADAQKKYNDEHEQVLRLRQELAHSHSFTGQADEFDRQRTDNK